MAHHKSAKKRIKVSEKRRLVNKSAVSKIKTLVKNVFNAEDKTAAGQIYKDAVSALDKNALKGRLHRNTASRKKAALTKYFNSLPDALVSEAL
ncbi:MAG: 30S ribosomal protein S20 [Ignavibacteria bacterium]